jgi:predicted TIM-barrel fold metal-dependent hydrolase
MIIDCDTLFGFWPSRPVDISLERLLGLLNRYRIDRACTCSARGVCYDYVEGNAETIETAQGHSGLIPVLTIDPRKYLGCAEEIRRRAAEGFKLFRLFPEYQGWSTHSPSACRILGFLEDAGAILLLGGPVDQAIPAVRDLRIPVILTGAHFYQLADVLAWADELPHVYVSTRLLIGPGAIQAFVANVGHERLVFGSHAPLVYLAPALRLVEGAGLSAEQRAAVMGGNLQRLLGGDYGHH